MSTFGNTSTSSISQLGQLASGSYQYVVLGQFTLGEAGDVSKLTVYIDNASTGHAACNIRGGIYTTNGALMGSATVAVADSKAAGWVDITFASSISLTAGKWMLCVQGDSTAQGCQVWGASSGGDFYVCLDYYADGLDDPGASAFFSDDYNLCIYATYSTGGGTAHLWVPSHLDGGFYDRMAGGL